MSGFTNNIRTILQLDDKDWKKSLDSIKKAEQEHSSNFKQLQREQAEALQAKSKILIDQNNKVSSLENEIINKINEKIKVRQNEAKLDEQSKKESIALINKEIALLRDKKNIEREIAKGYKVDYSSTEKGFKSLIDFNQNYTNILKTTQEELKNIGEVATQTIEKQIAEEKKYQKAKYDTVTSLLNQKRKEEELNAIQDAKNLEKQISEEKKYQKAKYDTISSLLSQKRAEEALENKQKQESIEKQIAEEKKYQKAKYDTVTSLLNQKRKEEELNAIQDAKNLEKQISEEKKYQKAKYDTISSLLSQKRAEEALENKQKQESIEKQIAEEKKYQKAKYDTVTSLLNQKRKEEELNAIQDAKNLEKQISEEKKYQKAKYDTISSLLSQKRAEEALENKQKQESIEKQIAEEKKYQKAKYETITSLLAQKRAEEQLKSTQKEQFARDYINTPAQNKYNDALSKLNDLEARGIITSKEKEKALAKEKLSIDAIDQSTSSLANTTIRYLRWAGTIAGVFYAGQRAWDMTLGKGIEVNKMIEDNTTGIAALLGANTSMILSNGKVVNSYEKFQMGLTKSKEIMDNIRVAAKSTYATFPQLTEIYQQAIGQTLSFGTSFGKTVDDISNNTVKLAQRMSNIGGAIGQPMDRIKEEIRSMVSANVSTDSIISTMIFGSPTQANEAIKKAKEAGTNGLKDMLDSYLKAFDVLEGVKTYTKAQLDLQDAISQTQGQLAEPTFNALKEVFNDLAVQINKMKDDKTFAKWGENIVSTAKAIVDISDEAAVALATFLGWKLIAPIIETTAKSFGIAQVAASQLALQGKSASTAMIMMSGAAVTARTALVGLATSIAPIAAVMVVYEGYNWLIGDNIKKEERLREIMSSKVEDLNKLSSSQLIYNKALMDEQFIIKTKAVQDAKSKVANKGIFGKSELEQKADNAALSTAQEELENLRKVKNETSNILTLRESILKKAEEINKSQKDLGDLTVKLTRDSKIEEDSKTFIKKEEEEIVKLAKQKKSWSDELVKSEKALGELRAKYSGNNTIKFEDIDEVKKQQEYIKNLKEGILQTDKAIRDEQTKKSKIATAESDKIVKDNIKLSEQAGVRAEINAILNGTYNTETYMVDMARIKVESAIEEYEIIDAKLTAEKDGYQRKLYQIQLDKDLRDILVSQLEYEEKITKLQEKQNSFSNYKKYITTTGLDQESANQLIEGLKITYAEDPSSLADLEKFTEKLQRELDKKDLTINIKFQGFDTISEGIASAANSFQDMRDAQAKYDKESKSLIDNPIKLKQAQLDLADAIMTSYSSMIGAVASFYDEDDSRREKQLEIQKFMNATKMAMQLAELAQVTTIEGTKQTLYGTTALANALTAPFPANIPAFAAVAGMLASIGIMIGGSTKTSTTSDAFSSMKENKGTGSVLGNTEKQTESIVNALSLLQDFAQPQYRTLQSMNSYLESIANNIGGVTSLLIQSGGFAFGEGYEGFDTGFSNNVSLNSGALGMVLNPINSIISKIPVIGQINKMFGDIMGSVLGGLFGKTSVSQELTDSGIYFANTLLSSAIDEFNGKAYQTITTTVKKKSLFSSSSSSSIASYFKDLDSETNRQFSLVLDNLYQTTLLAGEALDSSAEQTAKSLENFVVSIGKISLKDKTGSEIQEELTAVFGKIGDDIAKASFPLLTSFQRVGEGMFETMTRVATGMEEAEYYIGRLGSAFEDITYTDILNKSGDVGFEALLQSIVKTDEAVNGLDNNLVQIITSLDSTAEELYTAYTSLDNIRNVLKYLNLEAETLSFASIRGAGSLEALASGIQSYTENFLTESQQLSLSTSLLQKEFNKLNIAMPVGKEGFTSLINSIDKTSESGQELFGRLMSLAESFASVADSVEESIQTLEDSLKDKSKTMFDNFITTISKMFDSIVSMAENTQNTILGIKTKDTGNVQETVYNQFVEYNKLLAKFESAQLSGDTKTAETAYNSLLGLSTTLSDAGYQTEIVGLLEDKLAGFNNTKDILRVNVVDGLGELLSLTELQTSQLKYAAKDGAITNSELSSISGLTEAQLSSIKEFASNSNYFSTEDTLSNLEEYSKLQLEILKKSQADEAEALSSKTFATGDYIGTQEKIDISKLLGVSYGTAEPLIKNLQGIDNLNAEQAKSQIASLIGYKTGATSYDTSVASQIEKLSSYLGTNASASLSSISTEVSGNIALQQAKELEKKSFLAQIDNANIKFQKEKTESDAAKAYYEKIWHNISSGDNGARQKEDFDSGTPYKIKSPPYINEKNVGAWSQQIKQVYSPYLAQFGETQQAYSSLQSLLNEKAIKGYAVGSPYIEYDQLAQIHKGEAIIPKTFNEGLQQGDLMMGSTNSFTRELSNIKTVLLDQSRYFNGIITELKNQVRILIESRDIQNESLVMLENIEGVI